MKIGYIALLLIALPLVAWGEASILNPSGLPVPRYVSLKSNDINVRVGPGKRYPIHYVYQRAHLPVQIIEEFAHWRKIADYEGSSGWVHKGMVDGKRTALILRQQRVLYAAPDASSRPVMRANPLVVGLLKSCAPVWCQLEINGRKGWIHKADIWGVSQEEVFED